MRELIEKYRKEKDLSVAELAQAVGMERESFTYKKNNLTPEKEGLIQIRFIRKLAKKFGISPAKLLPPDFKFEPDVNQELLERIIALVLIDNQKVPNPLEPNEMALLIASLYKDAITYPELINDGAMRERFKGMKLQQEINQTKETKK